MRLELFPCSGGMAEGFRRAGITFDMSFDYDAEACASYTANLGHAPIRIDVRDLVRLARAGWSPGPIDLLVADPPCTPWSRAGKRLGLEDERDMLAETCDLIGLLRPEVWVIGNVPGLDDAPNAGAIARTMGALTKAWHVDYARLDAADFGVPQHRVRPFWVGHLHGTKCIRWPDPTHGSAFDVMQQRLDLPPLARWVTCRDALADLPVEEIGRPVRVRVRNDAGDIRHHDESNPARTVTAAKRGHDTMLVGRENHPISGLDEPARCIKTNGGRSSKGGSTLSINENGKHAPSQIDEPAKTVAAAMRGNGRSVLIYKPSTRGPQGLRIGDASKPSATVTSQTPRVGAGEAHVFAWPWKRPATTLQSDERIAPPGHHGASFTSDANAIVLSERAALRLQGFPDGWKIVGATKRSRWSQIGMAMPPPLAEVVARAIVPMLREHVAEAAE
jgi:DNA-cytosine methyltransferase